MRPVLEALRASLRRLSERLVLPHALEADSEFRASLSEVMHVGLRWGGISVLLGTGTHVALSVAIRGERVRWTYSAPAGEEVAVLYHGLVVAVGLGLLGLSFTRCGLRTGRLAGAVAALVAAAAAMHDDLLHGTPVAVEYVIMIYMVAIVTVPFRPEQALGVGAGLLGLYGLFVDVGVLLPPAATEAAAVGETAPSLGMAIVLGTAVSTVLYATRHTQHRVRREAQATLAAEKERTERALATVEQQAEQLREVDEMKTRFFANVSHELRTPLSLLLGPLARLLGREDRSPEEAESLRTMQRNAERMRRLVEQLLRLARHDAGRVEVTPVRREWGAFVERVVRRLAPMAEAQGVSLSVETAPARAPAIFDPDHMETVVSSLLRNALRTAPGDSVVAVRAVVEEGRARLEVRTPGPAGPVEEQGEGADQGLRGETGRGDGSGIGRALAEALVGLHEGTIEVGRASDEGRVVSVAWPATGLDPDDEAEAAAPPADRRRDRPSLAAASPGGGRRERSGASGEEPDPDDRTTILVVEDNADLRRFIRRLLGSHYRVIEAEDGRAGLERTRSALPDLVVADVMMPGMDGVEMVERLRHDRRTEHIPVVMLTARAETGDRVDGLSGGAQAYLTKPFDADVLRAQIDSLIDAQRQLRSHVRERRERAPIPGPSSAEAEPPTFGARVRRAVHSRLSDADLTVEELAEEVGCTRRTLTRKVKAAFGQSPSALIRTMRLEKGADLLEREEGSVSEIAYAVGFNSLSYFSRRFKKHFGVSPTTYRDDASPDAPTSASTDL